MKPHFPSHRIHTPQYGYSISAGLQCNYSNYSSSYKLVKVLNCCIVLTTYYSCWLYHSQYCSKQYAVYYYSRKVHAQ